MSRRMYPEQQAIGYPGQPQPRAQPTPVQQQAPEAMQQPFANAPQTNPFGHAPAETQQQQPMQPGQQRVMYPQNAADQSFDTTSMRTGDRMAIPQTLQQQQMQPQQPFQQQQQMQQSQSPGTTKPKGDMADNLPRPLNFLNLIEARSNIPVDFEYTHHRESLDYKQPPEPSVPYVGRDSNGLTPPRYLRTTSLRAPQDQAMQTSSGLPFGLMIQPFASATPHDTDKGLAELPLVDFGEDGPFRCNRCKAYVNPFFKFTQDGRKATCNLCLYADTEVPGYYFCSLDGHGNRLDVQQRPELLNGAYDFVANSAFMSEVPTDPAYVFAFDCSLFSVQSGFFHQAVASLKSCLDYFTLPEVTNITIMTYDQAIHFYTLTSSEDLTQLQIGDVEDPFAPLPASKLQLNLAQDREKIDTILDKLYNAHSSDSESKAKEASKNCAGAACKAATDILSQVKGGRVCLFSGTITQLGCGKVTQRAFKAKINTAEETAAYLAPESTFWTDLGTECVQKRIAVDIFVALSRGANIQADLATIAPVVGLTGGDLHYFTDFDGAEHGEKLYYQMFRIVTRVTNTDITMKLRVSSGLSVSDYIGSFMRSEAADMALAALDSDKVISCVIRNDTKLVPEKTGNQVFAQYAVLYTTPEKERRIRVLNFNWFVAPNLYQYFKSSDVEACAQFKIRFDASKVVEKGAKATREKMIESLVDQMANYRTQCAQSTNPSQLVLPETLKRLPLYVLSALKNPAFQLLSRVMVDKKIAEIYRLVSMPLNNFNYFFYPRLYRITDLINDECDFGQVDEVSGYIVKPRCRPCRIKSVSLFDCYLIDDAEYLTIVLGSQGPVEFLEEIFGCQSLKQLKRQGHLPAFVPAPMEDGNLSEPAQILSDLLEQIRYERVDGSPAPTRVIIGGEPRSSKLTTELMVEETTDSAVEFSYTEFLQMLHKRVRTKTTS